MIQIIKKEYKDLDKAVQNINAIAINYDYFIDYNILPVKENYIALLKFDIPNKYKSIETLDIAKIKEKEFSYILNFEYEIILEDKELENKIGPKSIWCEPYGCNGGIRILCDFGIKDFIDIINIVYIDNERFKKQHIELTLNIFEQTSMCMHPLHKEIYKDLCEYVDYNILYNHIADIYLQRGYLLDRKGLEALKNILKRLCGIINSRNIDD